MWPKRMLAVFALCAVSACGGSDAEEVADSEDEQDGQSEQMDDVPEPDEEAEQDAAAAEGIPALEGEWTGPEDSGGGDAILVVGSDGEVALESDGPPCGGEVEDEGDGEFVFTYNECGADIQVVTGTLSEDGETLTFEDEDWTRAAPADD